MKPFDVEKEFRFALASTLTALAKEAAPKVVSDIRSTFTVRGSWLSPGNAMGIKALPASKNDLESAVVTRADWLERHEEGGDKTPTAGREHLAVPTGNVRRTKRELIRKTQRPRNLKKSVVLKSRNGGEMIFERRGKRLVPLYRLIRRARIRKEPTITEQTGRVVEKRFDPLFYEKLAHALKTAR